MDLFLEMATQGVCMVSAATAPIIAFTANHLPAVERPLNSKEKWEEVVNKLNELAIRTKKVYNPQDAAGSHSLQFDLPVTGYWAVQEDRRDVEKNWLFYKGKHYDPAWIYVMQYQGSAASPHSLKPICRTRTAFAPPAADDGDPAIVSALSFALDESVPARDGYFEIDLGSLCQVSRLITLGGHPKPCDLARFPALDCVKNLRSGDRKQWRKARRAQGKRRHVLVMEDPTKLSWVTSYELSYRAPYGKWTTYPVQFDGNFDVGTECSHEVELVARHIRIYPKTWQHAREMIVSVFGTPITPTVSSSTHNKPAVQTVTYELVPRDGERYRAIGGYRNKWDRRDNEDIKNVRKRGVRENMKDDFNSYYCGSFCCFAACCVCD